MKYQLIAGVAGLSLALSGAAMAQDAPAEGPAPIIRATDSTLTCVQMSEEAAQLSQAMGGEPDGGLFGTLGGVARSGAALLIPGAGLVMAGADVLTQPDRDRREAEAAAIRHRWYYLNGLYAGQRCQQQAEAAEATAPQH
ncbi:hypothetical protein [uncultured Brevundimonas sp.]|uniref:hypothetical protein n=1 Tax=uncultured Brevundimonas sp. TaxID=213418 RepID=UPI0030EF88C1|tara:strand:- start:14106 stop:14525 length:420 start_codon:yes stop_codon:yes gene_type:complete